MIATLATAAALAAGTPPPSPTAQPRIVGTPRPGGVVHVDPGTWTGNGTIWFWYVWQQCDAAGQNCASIPGENGQDYTVRVAAGQTIRAVVTAYDDYASTRDLLAPVRVQGAAADTTPPAVTVVAPKAGARPAPGSLVRVVVRVVDPQGPVRSVRIGGVAAARQPGGTTWSRLVRVAAGVNRVPVVATDGANVRRLVVTIAAGA